MPRNLRKWILLQRASKAVYVYNIYTSESISLSDCKEAIFDDDNASIVMISAERKGDKTIFNVKNVNLKGNEFRTIWNSEKADSSSIPSQIVYDAKSKQFSFFVESRNNNSKVTSIWYYRNGMEGSRQLLSDTEFIKNGLKIANIKPRFNYDGTKIYFRLTKIPENRISEFDVSVDVWNYRDVKLQSLQLKELGGSSGQQYYLAVLDLLTGNVIQLEKENEEIINEMDSQISNYAIIRHQEGHYLEWNWNDKAKPSISIISLKDGTEKYTEKQIEGTSPAYYSSPTGKWIVYFDGRKGDYYSIDTVKFISRNITKGLIANLTIEDYDKPAPPPPLFTRLFDGDSLLFVSDNYDIWKIDLAGNKNPVSITQGIGRKNKIKFWFVENSGKPVVCNGHYILAAFNSINKKNGFYSLQLGVTPKISILTMENALYHWPEVFSSPILKARDAEKWLIPHVESKKALNYFATNDFKTFDSVSNIQPQEKYNWLTTELVNWKTFNGQIAQGILYKPENFDPKKKYPIIFLIYEKFSDRLNEYLLPELTGHSLNIPYFVSNGYLVFQPDIKYTIGEPGPSAYNYIISAAKYFKKISWIDEEKMGINGHSFGAFQVNYIITNTSVFSAAAEAAGVSDFISGYGTLRGNGTSRKDLYEFEQSRIGKTLWQAPQLYIRNSPIFSLNKVVTPLLMMHNKGDKDVPIEQAMELFTGLRRLGKRSWLLQYDNGDHELYIDNDPIDYTKRLTQFFNHYLKNAPAPVWMSRGIPARLKGIETGYAYDPSGNCGRDCKVCKMWNVKMTKDSVGTIQEMENRRKQEHWQ